MSTILNVWCDICVHLQAWAILGGGLIVWYAFHTERRDMREGRHQTPTPNHVARSRKVVAPDLLPGSGKKVVHQTPTLSVGRNKKGVTTTDTLSDVGRWAA